MGEIEIIPHPEPSNVDPSGLWVDDCKPAPTGIENVARTYDDALALCRRFTYGTLYLDHDLGDDGRTGYDLLLQLQAEGRCPDRVVCISWNPVGRKRIEAALLRQLPLGSGGAERGSAEP